MRISLGFIRRHLYRFDSHLWRHKLRIMKSCDMEGSWLYMVRWLLMHTIQVSFGEVVMRCCTIEILTLLFRPPAIQPWYRILPRLPIDTKFPSCTQTKKVYDPEVIIYSSNCINTSHHPFQPHRKQAHLLFDLRRAPCDHPYLRSRLCIPQHPQSPYKSFEVVS